MSNFTKSLLFAFLIVFLIQGCKNSETDIETEIDVVTEHDNTDVIHTPKKKDEIITIYYNLPTPIQMSSLLKRAQASFYPELLCPSENMEKHFSVSSLALNLGIYGVDLGYLKFFDQNQDALKYIEVVLTLVEKLGLPKEEAKTIFESFEKDLGDHDSQLELISETYEDANKYLKENDKENIASLIILGGWIEGLYIASSIYEKDASNNNIINRIAEQKYSLNTILELATKYQDDPVVSQFYSTLRLLKKAFDNIIINYQNSNPTIDTINKVIILDNNSYVGITPEQIAEITRIIKRLRNEIIN